MSVKFWLYAIRNSQLVTLTRCEHSFNYIEHAASYALALMQGEIQTAINEARGTGLLSVAVFYEDTCIFALSQDFDAIGARVQGVIDAKWKRLQEEAKNA